MLESGAVKLLALFRDSDDFSISGDDSAEVSSLAYHSDAVKPGALFFCVPGFTRDGHEFAASAVEKGAAALCVERRLDLDVPQVMVPSVRRAMAAAAAAFHRHPGTKLPVIGVTGTNGKTTTAFLVAHLLDRAGRPPGLLGTVERRIGGVVTSALRTTPEAVDIQGDLVRMLEAGDSAAVLEVSSHALALHRADYVRPAVAVFTNLTQDHLDFHPDLEEYFEAKSRLFTDPSLRAEDGWAVINVGDWFGRKLAGRVSSERLLSFAAERTESGEADICLEDGFFDYSGFGGVLVLRGRALELANRYRKDGGYDRAEWSLGLRSRLAGSFNAGNALAALGACLALGVDPGDLVSFLEDFQGVPGRMERVDAGQSFAVLVDYAHTPDSVENVLRAVRDIGAGRVIAVIGCGGDRDRAKRPLMGRAGESLADILVVTSDNPRSEDPEAIIRDIVGGLERPGDAFVEADRREAMRAALRAAGPGDVVMILGKGHETGQEFAGHTEPFDDRKVAAEILAQEEGGPV